MDRTSLVENKQEIRTKVRNVMETHDVFFNDNALSAEDADSEEDLPVDCFEDPSTDRQEKEEISWEGSASARSELLPSSNKKQSTDSVDHPPADRDVSVAITSKVSRTASRDIEDLVGEEQEEPHATEPPDEKDSPKDLAADEVRADALRRRRLQDFKDERLPDAVVYRHPAVDEHLHLQRIRSGDPKKKGPAKPPIEEKRQADSNLAIPAVSKGSATDEVLDDLPDSNDRKPED
ncbi:hypothetical protein E4U19_004336 [Claviceps sp. Clav32 group G5]|nr:hypothetical protein E4U19_004336 [Claviceps sp. Clav32 group G5]